MNIHEYQQNNSLSVLVATPKGIAAATAQEAHKQPGTWASPNT